LGGEKHVNAYRKMIHDIKVAWVEKNSSGTKDYQIAEELGKKKEHVSRIKRVLYGTASAKNLNGSTLDMLCNYFKI